MGVTRELYNHIKESVSNETKKYGTLLQYLSIAVINNNQDEIDMSNTPVSIKLKLSDDMKDYDSFKLVYFDINDQGEVIFGDPVTLTVKEIDGVKYLVGDLPHLSAYALVGDKATSDNAANPGTYDGILYWVFALVISLGIIIIVKYTTKKNRI